MTLLFPSPKARASCPFLLSERKKYPTSPDTSSQGSLLSLALCFPLLPSSLAHVLLQSSLLPLHCHPSRKTSLPLSETCLLHPNHFQMPLPTSLAESLMQNLQGHLGLHLAWLPVFSSCSEIPHGSVPVQPPLTSWQAWSGGEDLLQLPQSSLCPLASSFTRRLLCASGLLATSATVTRDP